MYPLNNLETFLQFVQGKCMVINGGKNEIYNIIAPMLSIPFFKIKQHCNQVVD